RGRVFSEAGRRSGGEGGEEAASRDGRRRAVLGSIGPGTKLPTHGHIGFHTLRDGFQAHAEGLIAGGADAHIVETTQDLL
ncbi:homocysteine S-methyltransferase family protein, partial [Streptomyces sp. GbtcB7]|uniref:homocysteine S-methyltransferase family protein n=1 Tax=Streptomyces sp. GbtcB7 TaxID=2824752 RepID=UPI001C2F3ABE